MLEAAKTACSVVNMVGQKKSTRIDYAGYFRVLWVT